MIRRIFVNRWVQYYIPLTLLLFSLVGLKREVTEFGELYGMPWGYVTGNLGCTGCYEWFVLPLLGDLLVYLAVVLLIFKSFSSLGLKPKLNTAASIFGAILIGFIIACFYVACTIDDQTFKLWNDWSYTTERWELKWL